MTISEKYGVFYYFANYFYDDFQQFEDLYDGGESADAESEAALAKAMNEMKDIYAKGTVGDENRCLNLEGTKNNKYIYDFNPYEHK